MGDGRREREKGAQWTRGKWERGVGAMRRPNERREIEREMQRNKGERKREKG